MQGHCTCIWKAVSLRPFLHYPALLPAKRASCLTIFPFPYHGSPSMSESIDKAVFTSVFDSWFVTPIYLLLYFSAWTTHIPLLLPHLHSWALGLCFSQIILTTSLCFEVCCLHVAAISIFPSLTCFLLNLLFHYPEPWQSMQERGTPSAAESPGKEKVLARGGCQYSPRNILGILRSSNSGVSFPMSLWPRCIPALWDVRSGSASASVIWSGSTGRRVKSLR